MIGSACLRLLSQFDEYCIYAPSRIELDVTDRRKLYTYLKNHQIDYIIYAVGMVGGIFENKENPANLIDANALMGLNGVWAAQKACVKKMIVFGSSCMYPIDAPQPYDENSILAGKMEETSIAYATAKILTLQAALANNQQFPNGTKFIAIIPNSTYGPNDNYDLIKSHVMAALIRKIHQAKMYGESSVEVWGSGKPVREFLYVDDLAKIIKYLLSLRCTNLPSFLNISPGIEINIKDLALLISEVIGYEGKILFDASKPNGVNRKALSNQRLNSIGWTDFTDLRTGIRNTYDWYRENNV